MSKSGRPVRIPSELVDKEAFSYKLSGGLVDIINLLRARSPRANHQRAFNLGIHKYHDAERRREFSRKQEAIFVPSDSSPPFFLFPSFLSPLWTRVPSTIGEGTLTSS